MYIDCFHNNQYLLQDIRSNLCPVDDVHHYEMQAFTMQNVLYFRQDHIIYNTKCFCFFNTRSNHLQYRMLYMLDEVVYDAVYILCIIQTISQHLQCRCLYISDEMKSFTMQNVHEQFTFTWVLYFFLLFINVIIGEVLALTVRYEVGIGIGLGLFVLEYAILGIKHGFVSLFLFFFCLFVCFFLLL